MTQQARHVAWTFAERADPVRFLIRDHDRTFTSSFDAVFEAQGTVIVRTPIQVPEANGIAERFVLTVRSECLDWLLIVNAPHLVQTLSAFADHYNGFRPHRSLELEPPNGRRPIETWAGTPRITVRRRDRLGGLLREYERAATWIEFVYRTRRKVGGRFETWAGTPPITVRRRDRLGRSPTRVRARGVT